MMVCTNEKVNSLFINNITKERFQLSSANEFRMAKQDGIIFTVNRLVLPKYYRKNDVLNFEYSSIHGFVSDRVIAAFHEEGVIGAEFVEPGDCFYEELVFDD